MYWVCIFLKKNLKIWKSIFKFVSEVAKFSVLTDLAIFSDANSYKDKKLKKIFCMSLS